ncbi:DUF2147 domain-containing protein [Facilibium subflavum]|uniref:DUF2147 domain-containing protein n=1 Tax=Facilibium subflavum TaxID=2219058 RepID=UPI000E655640|nr:DUF2147 domain-containing protein [Facilibium subflavum]
MFLSKKNLLCALLFSAFAPMAVTYAKPSADQQTAKYSHKQDLQSPEGYWLQYSDDGKGQSIIHVYKGADNKLEGKIVVPFVNVVDDKVQVPDVACKKCGKIDENGYKADYSKWPNNQVQNLKIMWGFVKDGESQGKMGAVYDDGSILDPANGKVYSCKMYTDDYGKKLHVRGYIGFSLFGRTQVWERMTKAQAKEEVARCGLTKDKTYPYADASGKITNQSLWEICSNIKVKK